MGRSTAGTVLMIALAVAVTVRSQTAVYHIGNSWTDQAYGMHDIAADKGYETTFGRHMIPGAPLQWIYEHPNDGFREPCGYTTCLPQKHWDVVALQPWDRSLASDTEYGGGFAKLAFQGNPAAMVLILACGPRKSEGTADYSGDFEDRGADYNRSRAFYESLVDNLRQKHPGKTFGIVPLAHIMSAIDKRLKAGQSIPNVSSMADLYGGDGHLGPRGKYVEAVAHFSVIFQADPHGAITSGLRFWKGPYSVSTGFAEVVWDICWDIVQSDPYCRVPAADGSGGGTGPDPGDTDTSSGPNNAPMAVISATPTSGVAPLTVTFDGSSSSDPDDGDAVWGYGWDFGDGETHGSAVTVEHTYAEPGAYEAIMEVRDYPGATDQDTVTIVVEAPTVSSLRQPRAAKHTAATHGVSVLLNLRGQRLYPAKRRPAAQPYLVNGPSSHLRLLR